MLLFLFLPYCRAWRDNKGKRLDDTTLRPLRLTTSSLLAITDSKENRDNEKLFLFSPPPPNFAPPFNFNNCTEVVCHAISRYYTSVLLQQASELFSQINFYIKSHYLQIQRHSILICILRKTLQKADVIVYVFRFCLISI